MARPRRVVHVLLVLVALNAALVGLTYLMYDVTRDWLGHTAGMWAGAAFAVGMLVYELIELPPVVLDALRDRSEGSEDLRPDG